mgnify:CR=1 FL=1
MGDWMTNQIENTTNNYTKWILIIGIILIASNLRAPLTTVGSLIPFIRDDLAISNALAGTITTIPLLAFAFLSPFAPKLAHKIGMESTIFLSLAVLSIGILLRSLFGVTSLFVGTLLIGLAIAIGNVLIPAFIKIEFPFKVGIMTGIYAVFMNVFASLASGLSVPISNINGVGWKGSLAVWVILSLIALVVWIPQLLKRNSSNIEIDTTREKEEKNIWKSALAWNITIFMGFQSLIFYTFVTWLPELLHHHGYSSTSAGWMLFLLQFAIIPITFIIPVIAERMENQKLLSVLTALFFIVGILGLMVGNKILLVISIIVIGIACGSAFSLSMMFFSMRTSSGKQAAELSGMAQSFGYLFAAAGPVLFGALYDITGGWIFPLTMLVVVAIIILIVGIQAGEDRVLDDVSKKESMKKATMS